MNDTKGTLNGTLPTNAGVTTPGSHNSGIIEVNVGTLAASTDELRRRRADTDAGRHLGYALS